MSVEETLLSVTVTSLNATLPGVGDLVGPGDRVTDGDRHPGVAVGQFEEREGGGEGSRLDGPDGTGRGGARRCEHPALVDYVGRPRRRSASCPSG